MAWHRTGTVTVTNNSGVVNGAGTDWLAVAKEGDIFQGPDMISYEITQIISATSLRISPTYRGGTAAGQNYALIPTNSRDMDVATGVSKLVQSYQDVRDGAGNGKFAAGTAGVPSLRGLTDQDTGVNFPGGNLLELICGGDVAMSIQDGVAGGRAVQSSKADATAGRLLKAGAMGIGGNLDMRRVGGDIDGTQPPSAFFGKGHMRGLADGVQVGIAGAAYGVLQIDAQWTDISAAPAIRRRFEFNEWAWASWAVDANTWSPWVQVNEPPVRGSNANGSYVRFANGLQFCQHTLLGRADTAAGSIYRSASMPWTFPAQFLAGTVPQVFSDEVSGNGMSWTGLGSGGTTDSQTSRVLFRATQATADSPVSVSAWGYYK